QLTSHSPHMKRQSQISFGGQGEDFRESFCHNIQKETTPFSVMVWHLQDEAHPRCRQERRFAGIAFRKHDGLNVALLPETKITLVVIGKDVVVYKRLRGKNLHGVIVWRRHAFHFGVFVFLYKMLKRLAP